MKHRDSITTRIARHDLFRTCSAKEREFAAKTFGEHRVTAGTTLMRQGGPAREFMAIVEGTVSIRRDGNEIAEVGPGGCIGEIALLDGGRRTATVVAESGLVVLVCGPREFASMMAASPNFTRRVATQLATRVRDTEALQLVAIAAA